MNAKEINDAIREVMDKDPIEMTVNYYKGLIQREADIIATCQKNIRKFQRRISELSPTKRKENVNE